MLTWIFSFKSFVVIKVMVGVNLIGYATRRRSGMEARQAVDVVNDFGRDPIGEGKEERVRFYSSALWASYNSKKNHIQSFIIANSKLYWKAIGMMYHVPLR